MDIANLNPGTLLNNRYEVIRVAGSGGMGAVYEAQDLELNRTVAIKFLHSYVKNADIKRLQREARNLSRVRHPNVLMVYAMDVLVGSFPFLVTEFIVGTTLSERLRNGGSFPVDLAVLLAEQLADGLAQIHKSNLVHRDLKTENIILVDSEKLEVKLIDFGLVKDLTAEATTLPGSLVGTPRYMSPEQCMGRPADHRSDIYSLGCILYELLTGVAPFECDSPFQYLSRHSHEQHAKLDKIDSPEKLYQLNQILDRCLEKDPDHRFDSASAVSATLRAFLECKPMDLSSVCIQAPPKKSPWSIRFVQSSALLVLLLAIFGVLFQLHSDFDGTVSPGIRKRSLPRTSPDVDSIIRFSERATTTATLREAEESLLNWLHDETASSRGNQFKAYFQLLAIESKLLREHEVQLLLGKCLDAFSCLAVVEMDKVSLAKLESLAVLIGRSEASLEHKSLEKFVDFLLARELQEQKRNNQLSSKLIHREVNEYGAFLKAGRTVEYAKLLRDALARTKENLPTALDLCLLHLTIARCLSEEALSVNQNRLDETELMSHIEASLRASREVSERSRMIAFVPWKNSLDARFQAHSSPVKDWPRESDFAHVINSALLLRSVPLLSPCAYRNFASVDGPNSMNLLRYNQAVGQAILVARTAIDLNGGSSGDRAPLAVRHARELLDCFTGKDSIGKRLTALFEADAKDLIGVNDIPLTAYLDQGPSPDHVPSTNITIVPALSPEIPESLKILRPADIDLPFLNGLTCTRGYGTGQPLPPFLLPMFVPLTSQRLVSREYFKKCARTKLDGNVPPNGIAFSFSRNQISFLEIGNPSEYFYLSIPHGYVEIELSGTSKSPHTVGQLLKAQRFDGAILENGEDNGLFEQVVLFRPQTLRTELKQVVLNKDGPKLVAGEKAFLYATDVSKGRKLTLTKTPPPGAPLEGAPDGPRHQVGNCSWQASSGFNNLLGKLVLTSK